MPQSSIETLLAEALRLHRAGSLAAAEAAYRRVLVARPDHAEAMYLLGVVAGQTGQADIGIEWIQKAIARAPDNAVYHRDIGVLYQTAGRIDDAIASGRRSVEIKSDSAESHYNLAIAQVLGKQPERALESFVRAAALRPAFFEAHYSIANLFLEKGESAAAIAPLRRCVERDPKSAAAHHKLGGAFRATGDLGAAVAAYRRAVEAQPDFAEAHNSLGIALRENREFEPAAVALERAIELRPDYAAAWNNLGMVRRDQGEIEKAVVAYERAVELAPDSPVIINNLGIACGHAGRPDRAIECYERALAVDPNYVDAQYNLGLARYQAGDFAAAWELYERRWDSTAFEPRRPWPAPIWSARDGPFGTVLLTTEQGAGDMIQYIRFVPLVAALCRRVVLECPANLLQLFGDIPGIAEIIPRGRPLPAIDAQCPLMTLPRALRTTLDTIPRSIPYLHADPARASRWSGKAPAGALKIGICWAGSPIHKNDRNRSMLLAAMAPLAEIPDAIFFSLQKGEAARQARTPPVNLNFVDAAEHLDDLADTAALIAGLDLVISVDTVVVHLAGALGKPVWTLLPFAPDWRWMLDRSDSPWYPTMTLFRQPAAGDWGSVMRQVVAAARHFPRR